MAENAIPLRRETPSKEEIRCIFDLSKVDPNTVAVAREIARTAHALHGNTAFDWDTAEPQERAPWIVQACGHIAAQRAIYALVSGSAA